MEKMWKYIILASAVVLSAMVLAAAYTNPSRNAGTISVVGLGETEFVSDLIVIRGAIVVNNEDAAAGYTELEAKCKKITDFLVSKGVEADGVTFAMPSISEDYEDIYDDGNYVGRKKSGYNFYQSFTIESKEVDRVEAAARELPSLMTQGVMVSVYEPMYYYTELESVKHNLIAAAAEDARLRAELIATNSNARLGQLATSRAGVFQITAATGDEEFLAGGSFNLLSREKKARVTVRAEYKIKTN
ncbi:MAG: SIMPL domain-containing protein [Alistipes sp.]|nr:SIMPL domain-containing protein [Alistipes sp.]